MENRNESFFRSLPSRPFIGKIQLEDVFRVFRFVDIDLVLVLDSRWHNTSATIRDMNLVIWPENWRREKHRSIRCINWLLKDDLLKREFLLTIIEISICIYIFFFFVINCCVLRRWNFGSSFWKFLHRFSIVTMEFLLL